MSHVTSNDVKKVYGVLREATIVFSDSSIKHILIKSDLGRRKAAAMINGDIDSIIEGRGNAEKREAAARDLFEELYELLEIQERLLGEARIALDVARIDVEEVRALLRLSELEANIVGEK